MKSTNKFTNFLHSQYKAVKVKIVGADKPAKKDKYSEPILIDEGSQKQIFKVYDFSCSREVALATLKNDTVEERAQFLREARITALLQHPNIMPVYEVGTNKEGLPYFTMKLGQGENLGTMLASSEKGTLPSLLAIFIQVCDALAYAHNKGVIHRDLKPENIYLGKFGEVLLCDWGLAAILFENCDERILDDEDLAGINLKVSLKGMVKGSPGFIAPEIINESSYTVQSDIFALGAVLYFVLTGKAPVQGKNVEDVLSRTKAGDFSLFEDCSVSESLKAICSKALSVDAKSRYSSVEGMIVDLKSYQGGFAPKAEEASLLTQLNLFYLRNSRVCRLVLIFLLSLALVVFFFIGSIKNKERRALELLGELTEANLQRETMGVALAPRYLMKAQAAFKEDQPRATLALLELAYNYDSKNNEVRDLYGKMLMALQMFTKAAEVHKGVNDELYEISLEYAKVKKDGRLSYEQLLSFLKVIGTSPENSRDYIYRNVLFEEFLVLQPKDKLKLLADVIKMRNELVELNGNLAYEDGAYIVDLSGNPGMKYLYILEKLGAVVVKKLDLSDMSQVTFSNMNKLSIIALHVKNTGRLPLHNFNHYYEYLDAEGSRNDFSKYLKNKPVRYLNIHQSGFRDYGVLATLKNLERLTVSKGKLPDNVRRQLPKKCVVVEK